MPVFNLYIFICKIGEKCFGSGRGKYQIRKAFKTAFTKCKITLVKTYFKLFTAVSAAKVTFRPVIISFKPYEIFSAAVKV